MRAGIALGSNLGDRNALIQEAIGHLRMIHESGDFLLSSLHETEPVDCAPGSPPFLNAVAEIGTSLQPLELLRRLQGQEIRSGRPKDHPRNASRTLDLDILYCDEMSLHHPELDLPHPRMLDRAFVMAPLAEIRPELKLPGWQMTCLEYLSGIRNN
ncbi:MAG: 2-amino-4-hydroxy-6-hydroxymethyldihydropteridine diphosphokinase [Chthoniobacterales bacterium]